MSVRGKKSAPFKKPPLPHSRPALPHATTWRVSLRPDPRLNRLATTPRVPLTPRAATSSTLSRRFAAEVWVMRDDGPSHLHDPLCRTQPLGSAFALLAPMLAAPFGPSAMCFLRPARGFGWPDPRLNRLATTPRVPLTPRAATSSTPSRRFAAEVWGMQDDAPPMITSHGSVPLPPKNASTTQHSACSLPSGQPLACFQ